MEVNPFRDMQDELRRLSDLVDTLLQASSDGTTRVIYEKLKTGLQSLLNMASRPFTTDADGSFRTEVHMVEFNEAFSDLRPLLESLPSIIKQSAMYFSAKEDYKRLVKRMDEQVTKHHTMMAEAKAERETAAQAHAKDMAEAKAEREAATQAHAKDMAEAKAERLALRDLLFDKEQELRTSKAQNMMYEIVNLYESKLCWQHFAGEKMSLAQAILHDVIKERIIAQELNIDQSDVRPCLNAIAGIKERRYSFGHLTGEMLNWSEEEVIPVFDDFALARHHTYLNKMYSVLCQETQADTGAQRVTLKEIRTFVDGLRRKNNQ